MTLHPHVILELIILLSSYQAQYLYRLPPHSTSCLPTSCMTLWCSSSTRRRLQSIYQRQCRRLLEKFQRQFRFTRTGSCAWLVYIKETYCYSPHLIFRFHLTFLRSTPLDLPIPTIHHSIHRVHQFTLYTIHAKVPIQYQQASLASLLARDGHACIYT